MKTNLLVKTSMIAALYVVLTFVLSSVSFGPIQVRVAMGLELFSFFTPAGIIGCTLGTLLSNILFGGLGLIDAVAGTLTTLICSGLIYALSLSSWTRTNHKGTVKRDFWVIAWMVPIIPTALAVGAILYVTLNVSYVATVITLAVGNTIAMFIGFCIFNVLKRNGTLLNKIKK